MLEDLAQKMAVLIQYNSRKGRLRRVIGIICTSQRIQFLKYDNFTCNEARIFKCLPQNIRDLTRVVHSDSFRGRIDKWLANILDQLPTPGY